MHYCNGLYMVFNGNRAEKKKLNMSYVFQKIAVLKNKISSQKNFSPNRFFFKKMAEDPKLESLLKKTSCVFSLKNFTEESLSRTPVNTFRHIYSYFHQNCYSYHFRIFLGFRLQIYLPSAS